MVPTSSSFSDSDIPIPGFGSCDKRRGADRNHCERWQCTVIHSEVHTVTAAEIEAAFAGTTINITLTDIDVKADPGRTLRRWHLDLHDNSNSWRHRYRRAAHNFSG